MDFLKMHFNALFDRFDLDHLKSVSKRLFILSLVLFILLSFFVVNSFKSHAEVISGYFTNQPIPLASKNSDVTSSYFDLGLSTEYNVHVYVGSAQSDTFVSAFPSDGILTFVFANPHGPGRIFGNPSYSSISMSSSDSSTGLYYTSGYDNFSISSSDVPIFSTQSECLSAISSFYTDGTQPSLPSVNSFTVPAGYVAYAQLSEPMQTVDLSTTMPVSSSLLPSNGTYWVSNQYVYDGLSLPVSGTTFPLSGRGSVISWNRGEPRNIFGVTKNAVWSFPPVRNLIAIYNPFNYLERASQGTVLTYQNGDIHVSSTSSFLSVSLYPLADNIVWSSSGVPSVESISQDDYSSPLTGDLDENGSVVGWLDSDGSPVIPPIGGGVNDVVNGISTTDIFSDFFARVESLLQNGVEAVRRLLSLSSSFFSVISSLWTWLPPEVYNVITSAVILVIVVGFFKAFL